jgi:YgiT-type zinc finger domain-containing protein
VICLICRQAEIVDGFTSISFQRAEMQLTVNNVPAQVCPDCGEAYVGEAVAARLLQSAEAVYGTGLLDDAMDYDGSV